MIINQIHVQHMAVSTLFSNPRRGTTQTLFKSCTHLNHTRTQAIIIPLPHSPLLHEGPSDYFWLSRTPLFYTRIRAINPSNHTYDLHSLLIYKGPGNHDTKGLQAETPTYPYYLPCSTTTITPPPWHVHYNNHQGVVPFKEAASLLC